jgi:hypothetical protein
MDFCTSLGVLCSAICAVGSSCRRFSASLAALSGVWETPYSPECVEGGFSEVRGSKRPLKRRGKHSTTPRPNPFGVEMGRSSSIRRTIT